MSEEKFTPGPWEYDGGVFVSTRDEGYAGAICELYGAHLEADAHLIAAAPELYEALEKIESCFQWEDYSDVVYDDVTMSGETIIAARAALAKARGEDVTTATP